MPAEELSAALSATTPGAQSALQARIAGVQARIAAAAVRADRDPARIRLIAVTKTVALPDAAAWLTTLAAAGIRDLGENRVEHLTALRAAAAGDPAWRFHFLGRVQGRQFADLVPHCLALHSLCDAGHLARLERACVDAGWTESRPFAVFVQVNASGETVKAGVAPTHLPDLLRQVRAIKVLDAVGLMTMAPALPTQPDPAQLAAVQATFARCRDLAAAQGLPRLSMGMSGDFELAIAAGATDLRLGSVLFAPDPLAEPMR